MIKWIMNNWSIILIIDILVVIAIYKIYKFCTLPDKDKDEVIDIWKDKVINWLIGACLKAEEMFGSNTGILKLTEVYDMFIKAFPLLVSVLPFEVFKEWVDIALIEVRKILENNKSIANIVYKNGVINSESKETISNQ